MGIGLACRWILLCVLFSVWSSSHASGWKLIAEEDISDIYIRLDSSSGKSWTVDLLINFKRPQTIGKTFRSSIDRMEFNCQTSEVRTLVMKNFTGQMGTGSVIFETTQQTEWKPIEAGSVNAVLLNIGCENRKSWT